MLQGKKSSYLDGNQNYNQGRDGVFQVDLIMILVPSNGIVSEFRVHLQTNIQFINNLIDQFDW